MQYILTEKEYNDLKARQTHDINFSRNKLQTLCTKIANEMPILFWDRTEAMPWKCRFSKVNMGYCDECPVQDICPSDDKDWSK